MWWTAGFLLLNDLICEQTYSHFQIAFFMRRTHCICAIVRFWGVLVEYWQSFEHSCNGNAVGEKFLRQRRALCTSLCNHGLLEPLTGEPAAMCAEALGFLCWSPQLPGVTEECIWTSQEGRQGGQTRTCSNLWLILHREDKTLWVSTRQLTLFIGRLYSHSQKKQIHQVECEVQALSRFLSYDVNQMCFPSSGWWWKSSRIHDEWAEDGQTRWWHQPPQAELTGKLGRWKKTSGSVTKKPRADLGFHSLHDLHLFSHEGKETRETPGHDVPPNKI